MVLEDCNPERRDQKSVLQDISKAALRYPFSKAKLKGGWTTEKKINCLLQSEMCLVEFDDFQLKMERNRIFPIAERVCRAVSGSTGNASHEQLIEIVSSPAGDKTKAVSFDSLLSATRL